MQEGKMAVQIDQMMYEKKANDQKMERNEAGMKHSFFYFNQMANGQITNKGKSELPKQIKQVWKIAVLFPFRCDTKAKTKDDSRKKENK